MDKDKLKELVLKYLAELLDETSATGNAGGYLTKAFARKPTSKDKNAPAGFETMPKSGEVYKKMGFRIVKPNERINSKDLWKGQHLEERIGYATPKAFKKPKKQNETSKPGYEDLPNPDKYFETVKFKIVDPKEKPIVQNKIPTPVNKISEIFPLKKTKSDYETAMDWYKRGKVKYDQGEKGHANQFRLAALTYGISAGMEEEDFPPYSLAKEEPLNEVRYSQFKNETKNRKPQEQLHMGVKEIQRKLDEINKLVEFTSRMKTELKGDAEQMNYLKRTHNALFKINEKIQDINNKIKGLTE
jgi:hypothetical protein